MAANKRTPVQIEKDRAEIASMYLRGMTQVAIAEDLDMTQQMVSYDLQRIQKAWQESALVDINEAKSRELARIDELERTYWAEWEASKEDRESSITKAVELAPVKQGEAPKPKRHEATIRKEERLGDPAYLRGVQWCIERRCAIVGIDAPKRNESKTNLSGELELTNRVDPEAYSRAMETLAEAIRTGLPGAYNQG